MKKNSFSLLPLIFLFLVAFTAGTVYADGKRLKTEWADIKEVSGAYTLILYGCNFLDDLETIAILDKEGDRYNFEPYTPEFNYSIRKGVSGPKALDDAETFVRCNSSFQSSVVSRIFDEKGDIIGYEVRPFYMPLTYGVSDVLDVDYRIRADKVIATIKLIPSVERMLRG